MAQQDPIRLFVAHAWVESDDYHRLFEYLESSGKFYYRNTARPEARPSGGVESERTALRQQIADAEIIIAPTSVYRQDSELLLFELEHARQNSKPILLIKPFGVVTVVPAPVMALGNRIVEWNQRELIAAIRELARQESKGHYDMIEFSPEDFAEFKDFKVTK
ncbi:MAG: hypothetical protein RLZZ200_1825 [Pseudomonadota bacterium]|jgi:hypothetical protein